MEFPRELAIREGASSQILMSSAYVVFVETQEVVVDDFVALINCITLDPPSYCQGDDFPNVLSG